ncbi:type II secretion system minor pseudopilin GspJ [Alcanivorax sp. 1008]|uniref:type II secretion system minor pseudopilin GspJ n=1 Tax=Alcanivorax sp. 1008 TaxID=2816853 RepID=UPI001D7756D9|nr:type II secretion system minor pseudopilin GspJ [Alcanivorax sp. 1008]MCC1498105.1 type II secretion system minor pseudopilin GspJ [Alcanivorax sp. 1008]
MKIAAIKSVRGFTLLEVVVAIAILAGIFVVALETFRAASDGRERLAEEATRLEARQRALTFLTLDFEQLIARPVRDALGDYQPALMSLDNGVALTRLGWANPFDLRSRSQMQRVEYQLIDNQLLRRYWPTLDTMAGTEPVESVLLEDVDSIQVRYLYQPLNGDMAWQEIWPDPSLLGVEPQLLPLPKSIELEIIFADGSFMHRYFRTVTNIWQ